MNEPQQLPLNESRPHAGPQRFERDGVLWRCERLDLLRAEVPGLTVEQLPAFCAAVSRAERPWLVVRRLFGLRPLTPAATDQPEDLRVWGRAELEVTLGVTRKQLQAELDAARGAWQAAQTVATELAAATGAVAAKAQAAKAAAFSGELELEADEDRLRRILEQYDFPHEWFEVEERSAEANRRERRWFCQRVQDFAKLLALPQVAESGRRLLLMELRLRRRDELLFAGGENLIGSKARKDFLSALAADDEEYRKTLEQVQAVAGWFFSINNALNAKGSVGELLRGLQEWYGQGKTDWLAAYATMTDAVIAPGLVDGWFTAEELQTLNRPHVEVAEPQYRLSLALYAQMVKASVWDPKWESKFPPRLWACLDAGFREGFMAAWKKEGLELPNLLREGPDGEHLPLPAEGKG